ncbi:MAG: 3-isopropylmalate dehydratase large subunit [Betaproteobacteria bacterium]|nr:3-isopropylmalate dehydratase large subunit [Betaproteobacteria bacterium]
MARTLFEKIWDRHVITHGSGGDALLWVDRHYVHEGSFHAFNALAAAGRDVRRPQNVFAFDDHYVPTTGREQGVAGVADAEARGLIENIARNTARSGIRHFHIDHAQQGIVHVAAPELGLTLPGLVINCGDSHTSTHGAVGAYAFGVGASQVKQVLATQCLWQKKPQTLRITIDGTLPPSVGAKDVILAIIARIGIGGAQGHVIEYAGPVVRTAGMEARMTICNMSIEAGARAGLIAPDATTYDWLAGRPYAPKGENWNRALAYWKTLPSDAEAQFDREVHIDASTLEPMVTWGTNPEEGAPVSSSVPDPDDIADPLRRARMESSLRYMDLAPGTPLASVRIDRVFIGSCTNGRLDDLRAAAAIVKGRKAVVPAIVSPGSRTVKAAAEAEGLDRVFLDAGFEWRDAGCSMCVGINGDQVGPGERSASTSNRNFEGRQGKGARTHLMGAAMAAAAAITGRITDVRTL